MDRKHDAGNFDQFSESEDRRYEAPNAFGADSSPTPSHVFPQFTIDSDKITVLFSPSEFHECLIDLYRSAQRRIVLAALYIGTGRPEEQVVDAVIESCRRALLSSPTTREDRHIYRVNSDSSSDQRSEDTGQGSASTRSSSEVNQTSFPNDPRLVVDILIDSARGRRLENGGTSLTMLEPLFDIKETTDSLYLKQNEDFDFGVASSSRHPNPLAINISLFHSPLLSGILYRVLPPRINEVLGVFHTKVFLVDNTVILTGANLSGSYLTNRQDRYIVIRDAPLLADFLHRLIRLIQRFSFAVELESVSQLHRMQSRNNLFNDQQSLEKQSSWWGQRQDNRSITLNNGKKILLFLQDGIPDPTIAAEEFKLKFGVALNEFSHQHSPLVPQTSLSSTTLHVAIQAGFCNPAIQQEQELLSILLSSPENFPLKSEQSYMDTPWSNASSRQFSPDTTSQSDALLSLSPVYRSLPTTSSIAPFGNTLGRIILASGYLNMADDLLYQLTKAASLQNNSRKDGIASEESTLEVFMAAPQANSFHQSKGLSKYIPMAYSYIGATQLLRLRDFWEKTQQEKLMQSLPYSTAYQSTSQQLSNFWPQWLFRRDPAKQEAKDGCPVFWEYDRASWTFHSKGVWFYPRLSDNMGVANYPIATIIGSSNFGLRSRIRDLDISFFIQTRDSRLQEQFHKEIEVMRQHTREVSDVSTLLTRCPGWLRFLLRWVGLKTLL